MQMLRADLSAKAARTLSWLCIPPNLLGFHYLVCAVESVAADPLAIKGLTTKLAPEIAAQFNTTPYAVMRDIRTAIKVCWDRGGQARLNRIYPYTVLQPPWPTEFIAVVAAHVARTCI